MIDFLSSLVDRTLDRMPVLQRRRPSLFEPSAGMMPLDRAPLEPSRLESAQEIVFEVESKGRERTVVESSSTAPKPADESIRPPLPAIDMESAQDKRLRGASPTPSLLESEARQREREQSLAPLPIASRVNPTAREETPGLSSREREAAAATNFAAAPLRVIETIVEREVNKPQADAPAQRPPVESNQTPTATLPAPSPPVKPVVVKATVPVPDEEKKHGSLPDQKVASQTPIEPRPTVNKELLRPVAQTRIPPSRRAQNRVADAPAIAPTIQVTIGRIEVRAAPPVSPPSRAARPATPKLSLEDYLRTRGAESK